MTIYFHWKKKVESKGELNEIEKLKLHINEIETITSVLLKLSSRLAKIENDLLMITDENSHKKVNMNYHNILLFK